MRSLLARLRKQHECWPPVGVVFDARWTCPECGTQWELVERANHSEWLRLEAP